MAAKMAMMAITTSNSMGVKPALVCTCRRRQRSGNGVLVFIVSEGYPDWTDERNVSERTTKGLQCELRCGVQETNRGSFLWGSVGLVCGAHPRVAFDIPR